VLEAARIDVDRLVSCCFSSRRLAMSLDSNVVVLVEKTIQSVKDEWWSCTTTEMAKWRVAL
jgi:hypothetical protein